MEMSKIIAEIETGAGYMVTRFVRNVKTYSTHNRACRYGCVRNAARIILKSGASAWVAAPFHNTEGKIYEYVQV